MFNIVTSKTVPCTACNGRLKITESAKTDDLTGRRFYEFKCPRCHAVVEYDADFIVNVLADKIKI